MDIELRSGERMVALATKQTALRGHRIKEKSRLVRALERLARRLDRGNFVVVSSRSE